MIAALQPQHILFFFFLMAGYTGPFCRFSLPVMASFSYGICSSSAWLEPGWPPSLPARQVCPAAGRAGVSSYCLRPGGFAGAIGSLWTVSEKSTAMLMARFYQLWRTEG